LLHLTIGIAIWFAGLFALGIVLVAAGRQDDQMDRLGDGGGGVFVLSLIGAIVGWYLFAYLDRPPAKRWTIFACVVGGTWLVMAAVAMNATT
jgi:hypothetical protein